MAISDLNPNIAEERARPRKHGTKPEPPAQGRPAAPRALYALEVPLQGARPIRCTIRAASLSDAKDRAMDRYPNAIPDRIRELTKAEARSLLAPVAAVAAAMIIALPASAAPGGRNHVDTFQDGRGASCERGRASHCFPVYISPNPARVPGPPLLAGLLAFYATARRIRSRIRS